MTPGSRSIVPRICGAAPQVRPVHLVGSAGGDKTEVLANAGFSFGERQRLILTAGQLRQSFDYAFPSGFEKVGLSQTSSGVSYQPHPMGERQSRRICLNLFANFASSRDEPRF